MNRLKSLMLALTLIFVPLGQLAHAQSQSDQTARAAKVRSEVAKRLANKKTRVKIKLADGGEFKGRIAEANDEWFTVVEDKTGKKVIMSYGAVEKLSGRGMGTFTKIGIVAAIAVAVVAVAVVVALKNFDPFSDGGIVPR